MSALKNIESWIERTLTTVIDFFYPPFRKVMSLELFRYAACGGMNLVLEWVLYYVFYHFIFHAQVFDLGFIAFTPHIAAFCAAGRRLSGISSSLWAISSSTTSA